MAPPSQPPAQVVESVHEGDVLAGKYRIERVLGAGGMGVVAAARHLQLDERVAIKFLLPEALANAEAVERFAREARAAVKIKSEHVARVIDVGTLDNGAPYMVMEYLDGGDLSALVRKRGPLPIEDAVEFVLQAAEAIAEAHAIGIVHRDLKPANLFLTARADGSKTVKVLDFGISKVTSRAGSGVDLSMTKTTAVMGSPLYMSPEQMASSRDVDARADIWALGCILHELLSARVPFEAETMPQLCAMILQHPPPPVRNFRPDAPEGLQDVIHRALQKNREQRFANVAELALALVPFGPRRARVSADRITRVLQVAGLSTGTLGAPSLSEDLAGPDSYAPGGHGTQASWGKTTAGRSRGARTGVGIAVVAVALAAAAALVLRGRASQPQAAVATQDLARTTSVAQPPAAKPAVAPQGPAVELAAPGPSVAPAAPAASAKPVVHGPTGPKLAPPVKAPAKPVAAPPVATPKSVDLYQDRK